MNNDVINEKVCTFWGGIHVVKANVCEFSRLIFGKQTLKSTIQQGPMIILRQFCFKAERNNNNAHYVNATLALNFTEKVYNDVEPTSVHKSVCQ